VKRAKDDRNKLTGLLRIASGAGGVVAAAVAAAGWPVKPKPLIKSSRLSLRAVQINGQSATSWTPSRDHAKNNTILSRPSSHAPDKPHNFKSNPICSISKADTAPVLSLSLSLSLSGVIVIELGLLAR
jgi:hypothetical protein